MAWVTRPRQASGLRITTNLTLHVLAYSWLMSRVWDDPFVFVGVVFTLAFSILFVFVLGRSTVQLEYHGDTANPLSELAIITVVVGASYLYPTCLSRIHLMGVVCGLTQYALVLIQSARLAFWVFTAVRSLWIWLTTRR